MKWRRQELPHINVLGAKSCEPPEYIGLFLPYLVFNKTPRSVGLSLRQAGVSGKQRYLWLQGTRRAETWLPVFRELKRRKHIPKANSTGPFGINLLAGCTPQSGSQLIYDSGQVLHYGQL